MLDNTNVSLSIRDFIIMHNEMYEEFRLKNHHDVQYPFSSFERQLRDLFKITDKKQLEKAKLLMKNGIRSIK